MGNVEMVLQMLKDRIEVAEKGIEESNRIFADRADVGVFLGQKEAYEKSIELIEKYLSQAPSPKS